MRIYNGRKYYKFRYRNKLYTRVEARKLGRTSLSEDKKTLYVDDGYGWHCFMYLQRCAYGQKYVEEDAYLKKRDKQKERLDKIVLIESF